MPHPNTILDLGQPHRSSSPEASLALQHSSLPNRQPPPYAPSSPEWPVPLTPTPGDSQIAYPPGTLKKGLQGQPPCQTHRLASHQGFSVLPNEHTAPAFNNYQPQRGGDHKCQTIS